MEVSLRSLQLLLHAVEHYPDRTPSRWTVISEYVAANSTSPDPGPLVSFGAPKKKSNSLSTLQAAQCKRLWLLMNEKYSSMMNLNYTTFYHSNPGRNAHKPVVLLPPSRHCLFCKAIAPLQNRPTFTVLYTKDGTSLAVHYLSRCTPCNTSFGYSYYDRSTAGPTSRFYYNDALSKTWLLLSSKTGFSMKYLIHIDTLIVICAVPFESITTAYNVEHRQTNSTRLHHLDTLGRTTTSGVHWDLNEQRLETAWFTYRLLSFFHTEDPDMIASVNFPLDQVAGRRDLESVCSEACDLMGSALEKWQRHVCDTPGCRQGYVSIDGNEKIKRPLCAADKTGVRLGAAMPLVMTCCPRSPKTGNQTQRPSKFCTDHARHEDLQDSREHSAVNAQPRVVLTVNLRDLTSTSHVTTSTHLPLPLDDATPQQSTGCKKDSNINRFYDRTAGILAMVRPCGIVVDITEMFTCESLSQVFVWLLRITSVHPGSYRYIGYDRACSLQPYLRNLKNKGNLGAAELLDRLEFLVDYFHCIKHTTPSCMPLDNPLCRFHPRLPKFADIHGVNTQVAEQTFRWLNRFKLSVRRMTQFKSRFFLFCVQNTHNDLVASKLQPL